MEKNEALAVFAALGQETRLDIFRLLIKAGPQGLAAGEIVERVGVVQNTASAHLKILTHAGLIVPRRDGRLIRYAADMLRFRDLLAFLMEDCCAGEPELCRPVIDAVTCNC